MEISKYVLDIFGGEGEQEEKVCAYNIAAIQ